MRVVFDTSLLVAAARSKNGASYALLSQLPDARFQPVVSVPLFIEYRAVLLRPQNLIQRSSAQAEGFLNFLLSTSHMQEVFFLWRPSLPDPNDDLILELAVAAGCRYIVTHNLRDFRGIEKWGITAMAPGDFLKLIKKTV
ncbi:MAG TPA: putative toxin-antitoxin system toxin component, PIN family [Verrucomicrobiae bacterium]|nr:putative toxin-antitoxin system toxin component, PIN family [Verrucomicrobiae bacterium]